MQQHRKLVTFGAQHSFGMRSIFMEYLSISTIYNPCSYFLLASYHQEANFEENSAWKWGVLADLISCLLLGMALLRVCCFFVAAFCRRVGNRRKVLDSLDCPGGFRLVLGTYSW